MNTVRSQTEEVSVAQLRAEYQAKVELAASSGVIPPEFEGDPTFRDAVVRRTKTADRQSRAH